MHPDQPSASADSTSASSDPVDRIIAYHVRTKHHFNRYARSLGYLDWANQPDPFRRFVGAPLLPLPLPPSTSHSPLPTYDALFQAGAVPSQPLTRAALSLFLELALGLSAWKKAGESEWALRNNPSSGNLHPTEGYVVLPPVTDFAASPGLYHYAPREHGLELRADIRPETFARLTSAFPPDAFLFGLTSVHWREAWKYGERAFRYCNHDVGHALASARFAAAALGRRMALLDGLEQNEVARLLGTYRIEDFRDVEPEHPDCVAVIWPQATATDGASFAPWLDSSLLEALTIGPWYGRANELSRDHGVHWTAIDDAADASWKGTSDRTWPVYRCLAPIQPPSSAPDVGPPADRIIRQRRSAVSFDARTSISAPTFFRMLQRLMPSVERPQAARPIPWDLWLWEPAIHLMLFVHRVDGLQPGLYVLPRDPAKRESLQRAMNPELEWSPVPGCPDDLPLVWLLQGDAQRVAAQVSCGQNIAGDSAFSLGMLAEFEDRLRQGGAWWYPRLFWEAGMVGQVLYLEAEAAGVRGTGIGCFFDDPVHEIVGIKDLSWQSLYHFTVGGPVEDERLLTLPPYHHLPPRD